MGFTTGEAGNGFQLDGINDYILVNASANLDVGKGSGFTIEGWINPASTATQMPIAEFERVLGSSSGADVGVHFYISVPPSGGTGSGCFYANIKGTNGADHQLATGAGLVTSNVWQHVALSYDKASGLAVIYLNGEVVLQANIGSFTPQTSFNLLFGARTTFGSASSPSDKFSGKMDELSIYGRALTPAEIQALYVANGAGKCVPTLPPSCAPPPSGLVSWWQAEGNALDSVGGNNGNLSNGVAFTSGEAGQAFELNGTTAHVKIAASSNLNVGLSTGLTIETWIKPATVSGLRPLVEWNNGAQDGAQFWVGQFTSDEGVMFANIRDTALNAHAFRSGQRVVSSNVLQHVALTYDRASGLGIIYVNGAVVAQASLGSFTPLTSYDLWLGRRPTYSGLYGGLLDEVSLYSRALTQNEIQAIYNAGSNGKCVQILTPVITAQPANQTVAVGGTAIFTVVASGTPPLSYLWYFSGTSPVAGGTNASLILTNVQLGQAGNYSVVVSNAVNSAASSNALLIVNAVNVPSCVTPPAGLVSWWRGESNALDSVAGINGSLQNGAGFAAGEAGTGFNLDGINDYVLVNTPSNLDVGKGSGFTIEGWINPATTAIQMPIVEYERVLGSFNGADVGIQLYISAPSGSGAGTLFANVKDSNNGDHLFTSAAGLVTAGAWQHVALSYDKASGLATLYLNGVAVKSTNLGSFTALTGFTNVLFGARTAFGSATSPSDKFSGKMDELSIYGRALTPAEIQAIYIADGAGKCVSRPPPSCIAPPAGLAAWWKGEGNGLDIIGSNTATLQSAVGFAAGEVGQAFQLNSFGAYLSAPASAGLNVGTNGGLTIEAWINPTNVNGFHPIAEWNNASGGLGMHLWLGKVPGDSGVLFANIFDTTGNSHVLSSAQNIVVPNVFQHVALTYDRTSGTGTLYVNGALAAQANLGIFVPQTSYNFWMGIRPGDYVGSSTYGSYLSGVLDELSLYKRALTLSEIQAIYNAAGAGKCVPVAPPSCTPSPTNLVSWWKAEGNALDMAGNNNGGLEGNIGFATGEVGQGFAFNNTNADIRIPASASLNVGANGGFTIESWINPSDVSQNDHPIAEWNSAGAWGTHFYIAPHQFNAGPGALYANVVDSGGGWHQMITAAGVVTPNVFQHVALTYDKTTGVAVIYRNGVSVLQQNLGSFTPLTTYDLYLGRRPPGGADTYTFAGILDELSLYKRALSATELQSIYNATSNGKCAGMLAAQVGGSVNPVFGPMIDKGDFMMRFAGIPGLTYTIESAANLGGPWSKAVNIIAPTTDTGFGVGAFEFREPMGANPTRFYRTVYPSY